MFREFYPAEPVPVSAFDGRPKDLSDLHDKSLRSSSIMSLTPNENRLLSPIPGQRGSAGWGSPSPASVRTANAKDGKSKICARCSEFCEGNLRFSCGRCVALCLKCASSFAELLSQELGKGRSEIARSNARKAGLGSRSSLSPSRVSNGEDATRWSHPLLRTPQPLGAASFLRILHARPVVESSAEQLVKSVRVLHRPAGRARGQSPSRSAGQSPEPRLPFSRSPFSSGRFAPAGSGGWQGEAGPAMPFPTSPVIRACADERTPAFDPLPARRGARVVRADVQPVQLSPLSPFRYAAHSTVSERRSVLLQ